MGLREMREREQAQSTKNQAPKAKQGEAGKAKEFYMSRIRRERSVFIFREL
jgi:hypothetical protein